MKTLELAFSVFIIGCYNYYPIWLGIEFCIICIF